MPSWPAWKPRASAARAKDWTRARDAYGAANKAQPSSEALDGLANADYQLKHEAEAYAFYTEWLKLYGAGATRPKKAAVEARLKELDGKTGALTLDVNEAGAAISVDERPFGTSPLSRLSEREREVLGEIAAGVAATSAAATGTLSAGADDA